MHDITTDIIFAGLDTGSMIAIIVSAIATVIAALVVGTTVLVCIATAINRRSTDLQIPQKSLQLAKLKINPSTQSESVNEC